MHFKLLVLAVFIGCLEANDLKKEYQKRCLLNAEDFSSPHRCSDGKEIVSFFYEKQLNSCHAVTHLTCHGDPKFFKNLEYCLLACTGKSGSVSEYSLEALNAEVKDEGHKKGHVKSHPTHEDDKVESHKKETQA